MDSFDRFEETELPPQGKFFNKLSGDSCSNVEHAVRVWDAFGCETMGDYHDVYLQLDVLLLTDFFEKSSLNYYKLDPGPLLCHTWTSGMLPFRFNDRCGHLQHG